MLSFPRKREPITTVSGIWVPAFARTTDQIAIADSRSAVMTLLRNDVDDDPVGGVYEQQRLFQRRILDSANDLSLLSTKLPAGGFPSFRLNLKHGEQIASYGFPYGADFASFTMGKFISVLD